MLKLAPRYAPKSAPKCFHALLVLSLLLPLAHGMAGASPSGSGSGSFKSGFSSQRSSPSASPSPSPSKGGFGSFGKRSSSSSSASPADAPSRAGSGSFGSFGRAAPADTRRSDSALSQKLDRDAAAARALRTLDERRAAQAARDAARNAPPLRRDDIPRQADNLPPPGRGYGNDNGYGNNNGYGNDNGYGNNNGYGRQPSGGDLGRVIAGAVIANAAANAAAHAANNAHAPGQRGDAQAPAPAPSWNGGVGSVGSPVAQPGAAPAQPLPQLQPKSGGASVFGTVAVLLVLALAGWIAYKWIMRARAKRAADKPNYSFERN